MKLSQALLKEYDLEMEFVRRHLEHVPDGKGAWKPAEKSMPLGWLATFLAILPTWSNDILDKDEFDVNPPKGTGMKPTVAETRADLLALFDKNVQAGRAALAKIDEAKLEE